MSASTGSHSAADPAADLDGTGLDPDATDPDATDHDATDEASTDPDATDEASTDTWDVIVVGGGPAGENAAQYATQGSERTAVMVEAELVGGECSYWACMPSKALLHPVEVRRHAAATAGLADRVGALDVAAVLARRDEIIHGLDDSSQVAWANGAGIDVVRGRARLDGVRRVVVDLADGSSRTLRARRAVVIATGTRAAVPPTDGLREARPWTSRDVTNLHEVPARVAVVGGGVVACESATWLSGLGAEVTVLQRSGSLLATNEPFAGEMVAEAFGARGVTIRFGAGLERVRRPGVRDTGTGHIHGGEVELTVDGDRLVVDEIVVAAGRTPASDGLGLESVGVDPAASARRGYLDVDDHLAVTGVQGEWLYAIGDINGRALLTHQGKYQGRICGAVIAARAENRPIDGPAFVASADHAQVPQVTFTDPQVASVGLAEAKARAAGIDVETVEYDLANVAGASVQRTDYAGRAKLVIDRTVDVVVGATFVGPEIGELLHSATIAVVGRVPLSVLWHAVPSYPTVSEVWLRLLEGRRPPG